MRGLIRPQKTHNKMITFKGGEENERKEFLPVPLLKLTYRSFATSKQLRPINFS